MTFQVITVEDFEQARLAFVEAWEKSDAEGGGKFGGGQRTTAGLTAALEMLGIKVEAR